MKVLCLSFIKIVSTLANPVPPKIENLVRSRIANQYSSQNPSRKLLFDDPQCSEKGSYTYTSSSLLLSAETESWSGTLELEFNSLLDGRKISFDKVSPLHRLFRTDGPNENQREKESYLKSPLLKSTVAVGLVAGLIAFLVQKNKGHSQDSPERVETSRIPIRKQSRF